MGIARDFFKTAFTKLNVNKSTDGYTLKVDLSRFGHSLDKAQEALDKKVWETMKQYMPQESGRLIMETENLNRNTRGEVYIYPPDDVVARYLYNGIVYEDPDYHVGGFFSPQYGWWSRPGVQKVPSGRELQYKKAGAVSHWDEAAYNAHKDEWLAAARNALR